MPPHTKHDILGERIAQALAANLGHQNISAVIEKGVHDLAGSEESLWRHVESFLHSMERLPH